MERTKESTAEGEGEEECVVVLATLSSLFTIPSVSTRRSSLGRHTGEQMKKLGGREKGASLCGQREGLLLLFIAVHYAKCLNEEGDLG